jgi:hypothetical protein
VNETSAEKADFPKAQWEQNDIFYQKPQKIGQYSTNKLL